MAGSGLANENIFQLWASTWIYLIRRTIVKQILLLAFMHSIYCFGIS